MSETMIHPETGAILRRRKRTETITYQGQSRTVEVEGWFPDNDGDGILVGADSKPLDDALAEMKCGWPGEPGVPPKSEYRGWHWLYLYNGIPCPAYWDGYWLVNGSRIQAEDLNPQIKYWGECLPPAAIRALKGEGNE